MIFGSSAVSVNKANQKLQDKGQSIIDSKISETRNFDINHAVQEGSSMLFNRPLGRSSARRMLLSKKAKIQESITKNLFKENLFDLFKGSLLLDEDFKIQQEANLYKFFEETFNNLMNENYFNWDSIKNNSCGFTKKLYALCEDTANLTADKLVNMDTAKNSKASKDALISEKEDKEEDAVEEEDKKEIDEKTKDDKKQVEKVVKDKVVKTIKDEKEAAEKEEDEEEEIKEKSKTKKEKESEGSEDDESSEGTTDDSETEDESDSDDDRNEDDTEESENSGEDNEESEDEKKSEGVELLLKRVRRPNRLRNESFFKSIQINVTNKFMNEKREGLIAEDVNINMDMIFAESIVYYTLLETFNTINIVNFTPSQAKKVCRELILN